MKKLNRVLKLIMGLAYCIYNQMALFITRIFLKKDIIRIVILYYHSIKDEDSEDFEEQLDFISRIANFVYPLAEIDIKNRYNVLITFDDALLSVLYNAQPLLVDLNIPFVVFVPAGLIGEIPDWEIDSAEKTVKEVIMNEQELLSLDQNLCTIGSHTLTHPRLSKLSDDILFQELLESKIKLEKLTGKKVDFLSFPYGDYNSKVIKTAQKSGYKKVFSIDYSSIKPDWNGFLLGRVSASPDDWKIETYLKIKGGYNWIGKRQIKRHKC